MNEFTPLPAEYNEAVGEFTPLMETFTDLSMEFSHTDVAPQAAVRAADWKNTVKKLLAAGTAVAATSWGVMGGLGNMGRSFIPSQVPREPAAVAEIITPGDAVEAWTGPPGSQAVPAAPAQEEPSAEPTVEPSPEPSAEPSVEPSEGQAETEDHVITPGDAPEQEAPDGASDPEQEPPAAPEPPEP